MLTPIGDKSLDFIIKALKLTNKIHQQYKILDLSIKTTFFTCEQVEKILECMDFSGGNRSIFVVILSLIYENVIDKENFDKIKSQLDGEKEKETFLQVTKNMKLKTLYIEHAKFTVNQYDENPNIYIEKVVKVKRIINDSSGIVKENIKRSLIQDKDFFEFLENNLKEIQEIEKFCAILKDKFKKFYISSDLVMDIISNKLTKLSDISKKCIVLEIYPYLYDPQNIERILNTIIDEFIQDDLRGIIQGLPNFYFEIQGEIAGGTCCCGIF